MKRFIPILLLVAGGCSTPYPLPSVPGGHGVLVVDGVIYAGNDSTSIRLTRSKDFSDSTTIPVETGAHVVLEPAAGGTSYTLKDNGSGYYVSAGLNLDNSQTYRLDITLSGGAHYQSDYVPVVPSPAIDSINFVQSPTDRLTIFANTHDPAGKTRYYMWRYVETYEYHSFYASLYKVVGDTLLPRDTSVEVCYRSIASTDILIASSAGLTADQIHEAPIEIFYNNDMRLWIEYSTLVTQIALTEGAYNYWQNMKANSENLGSIFGPQPFQAQGNIHSVSNPNEVVIGYVSISTPAQQRIFIQNGQLTSWPVSLPNCPEETADLTKHGVAWYFGPPSINVPIDYASPTLVLMAAGDCADCRYDGGTVIKPSYWP